MFVRERMTQSDYYKENFISSTSIWFQVKLHFVHWFQKCFCFRSTTFPSLSVLLVSDF